MEGVAGWGGGWGEKIASRGIKRRPMTGAKNKEMKVFRQEVETLNSDGGKKQGVCSGEK